VFWDGRRKPVAITTVFSVSSRMYPWARAFFMSCPPSVQIWTVLIKGDVNHQKESGYAHEGEAVEDVGLVH
jgi:hypothetical protein